jgi:hypothetical protein
MKVYLSYKYTYEGDSIGALANELRRILNKYIDICVNTCKYSCVCVYIYIYIHIYMSFKNLLIVGDGMGALANELRKILNKIDKEAKVREEVEKLEREENEKLIDKEGEKSRFKKS